MTTQELYKSLEEKHKNGLSWAECANLYNLQFGTKLNNKQIKDRIWKYKSRLKKNDGSPIMPTKRNDVNEYENFVQHNSDGSIDARKIIEYQQEVFGNADKLLLCLGFNPNEWEFINYSYSSWEQRSKNTEGGTDLNNLYAVKFKVKPKENLSPAALMKEAISVLKGNIKPFNFPSIRTFQDGQNNFYHKDKLIELCPVELHLGKIAESIETGEDYNIKIASSKFKNIIEKVVEMQRFEKANKCLVVIGNDFFNSEFDSMTHNKTPQQNDVRYKTLFNTGLELYRDALVTLREYFPCIDVMMCVGNHARAMEFFMYVALQQFFRNDNIVKFSNNLKDTQAYQFGNCAIFYNHGDPNLKQLIKSIPAEFYEIWGRTTYRELHLGHLHKEVTVDDESGMITRRIGSPCNTDAWHYQNRFIGAVKKHQVFIWSATNGLQSINYING